MQKETEHTVNTHPAKLLRALHTANLYVSILSSRNDLNTVKVASQDHNITTWAVSLKNEDKKNCIRKEIAQQNQKCRRIYNSKHKRIMKKWIYFMLNVFVNA